MLSQQNINEVMLRPGQNGLMFTVVNTPELLLPQSTRPVHAWMRVLISLLLSVGIFSVPKISIAATYTRDMLIEQTNALRVDHGLASLAHNTQLDQAALAKANDMIDRQYFDHTTPTGQSPWPFITAAGYKFTSAGENLALEPSANVNPIDAWMKSNGHRENILSQKYTDIGVAIVAGTYEELPTTLIVQFFGSRHQFISATVTVPAQVPAPELGGQPKVGQNIPLLSPSQEVEIPLEPIITPSPSSEPMVLGATSRVIPTLIQHQNMAPEMSSEISMMVFQVMIFSTFIMSGIVVLQLVNNRQKIPPLELSPGFAF